MCDIWKANQTKNEISVEELEKHLDAFRKLGVQQVALSGGEALMHSNLWKFCDLLRSINVKISLLSTGVTLSHHAKNVVTHCNDVIVSLDGSKETHNRIRNIPGAYDKLQEGVSALKAIDSKFRVTGRTVLQKENFRDFPNIIEAAKTLGLDQISFLAADVSSEAFNRPNGWKDEKISDIALSIAEIVEFDMILKKSFTDFSREYDSKFIAEGKGKMMEISQHYKAIAGATDFPNKRCNAPWVSVVMESDGSVLPCFFHKSYGNVKDASFTNLVNSLSAVSFRKHLNVQKDPICKKCVCSLNVGLTQMN
ncbi:MAG: radical SAM protein [Bacteroidia bacterium]|nr:radical SAM protein [Bacteroidia bacterium]